MSLLIAFTGFVSAQAPVFSVFRDYITGLSLPVFVTNAHDGSGRIFIVQQRGIIKVVQPRSRITSDFLDLTGVVSTSGNERGLLGLAFHPQYASNGRFFVYYTRASDGAIRIAEYSVSADPNKANQTPVRVFITIAHSQFSNHNGGTIAFGPDGYLYAGTGDGGSGNDPNNNAQNINSLLGKILRIDIDTPVGQVPEYSIPPTNPFAGATPGADEIYAFGMRNPYRFSFDRGGTHQLWVGDVGQDAIEEVDNIVLGGNYGWRVYEATRCTNNDPGLCVPTNYLPPVFEYSSADPIRCSVTGGYVYRGMQKAVPFGSYVYADYCSGEILLWNDNQQTVLLDTDRAISSFGEDENGELYVVNLGGTVDRILGQKPASSDFNGDGMTDQSVFRPSDGTWYTRHSQTGAITTRAFGIDGDIPAPEDYDGDGRTDLSVYRPSNATWYTFTSLANTFTATQIGTTGGVPAPADFDGDGKGDVALFTPSTGGWEIRRSGDGGTSTALWGTESDIPVAADYDADGKADVAVWRPSDGTWYTINSSDSGLVSLPFGATGDIPLPADYKGDGSADHAVYRPSSGAWYIREISGGSAVANWGTAGDIPVPGDYDQDGLDDIAIFRPSTGAWWVIGSLRGITQYPAWGVANDLPIARFDTP